VSKTSEDGRATISGLVSISVPVDEIEARLSGLTRSSRIPLSLLPPRSPSDSISLPGPLSPSVSESLPTDESLERLAIECRLRLGVPGADMNGNDNSIDVPGILRPDRGASMIVEVDAMDEVERGRRAKRTPWDLRE